MEKIVVYSSLVQNAPMSVVVLGVQKAAFWPQAKKYYFIHAHILSDWITLLCSSIPTQTWSKIDQNIEH